MRKISRTGVALGCWVLFSLPNASRGQTAPRTPVVTTPHFAIYSDFDTNLNDALIAAGLARKKSKPELFHSGAETACFDKLAPSARAAWDGAVDYYARIISPVEWNARQQFLLRMQLAGFEAEWRAVGGTEFVEIARSFRAAAAPAYKACRWTAQEENNRRWIEDMKPRLAADEQRIAPRIEQLYQQRWKSLPILVDVVETVDWSGANTSWSDSGQGDILISSSPQGAAAFETLFHEASHLLMDRGDPVREALESAARAVDFRLPNDLWHVVLFYTTGEAVRHLLDERGQPGYTPMVYEIFGRGTWVEYREALETNWRPYVDGERSLAEAAAGLMAALRQPRLETRIPILPAKRVRYHRPRSGRHAWSLNGRSLGTHTWKGQSTSGGCGWQCLLPSCTPSWASHSRRSPISPPPTRYMSSGGWPRGWLAQRHSRLI